MLNKEKKHKKDKKQKKDKKKHKDRKRHRSSRSRDSHSHDDEDNLKKVKKDENSIEYWNELRAKAGLRKLKE